MKNIFKYVFVIGNVIGFILIGIAIWRFKKTLKEHRKLSSNDLLSEEEKKRQNRSIRILIIGSSVIIIALLMQAISLFIIGR